MIKSPVPVGMHVAVLSCSSTGWLIEVTRVAALLHVAVAHGGEPELMVGNVQPMIL